MSMKKQFVWLSVACLVAIVAWFGLAFRPAQSQIRDLRADVVKTQQEVTDLEAKLQKLLALQRNSSGARDRAERLVGSLPTDPKVSDFILQVQDAANAAGIDFLSIAPALPAVPAEVATSTPTDASGSTPSASPTPEEAAAAAAAAAQNPVTRLRSIAVQIKADGEYFEIEDFVLKMERLARALRIDDFTLAVAGESQGTALSSSMKVQMFMLTPQAAAGAVPNGQTDQGTSEGA